MTNMPSWQKQARRVRPHGTAGLQAMADARRTDVYRADVAFAAEETVPLPPRGPARDRLVQDVLAARAAGETLLSIAVRHGFDPGQVTYLLRKNAAAEGKEAGRN